LDIGLYGIRDKQVMSSLSRGLDDEIFLVGAFFQEKVINLSFVEPSVDLTTPKS